MNQFQPSIEIVRESALPPTTGVLAIPMTNDYLFRALLQRNHVQTWQPKKINNIN